MKPLAMRVMRRLGELSPGSDPPSASAPAGREGDHLVAVIDRAAFPFHGALNDGEQSAQLIQGQILQAHNICRGHDAPYEFVSIWGVGHGAFVLLHLMFRVVGGVPNRRQRLETG